MYQFSQKLRRRIIAYFFKRHQVVITDEQAEQYLSSVADLYMVLGQSKRPKKAF